MNILFIGDLSNLNNTKFRFISMNEIGYKVEGINIFEYISKNKFLYWINYRFQIYILNYFLLRTINLRIKKKFDLIWVEKGIFIDLSKIKNHLKIPIIHFNPDNPFGKRNDGCWKLFLKNISKYDYHLTPRFSDTKYYNRLSANKKMHFPFCYDANVHYPENIKKDLDVTFIGSNHDKRINFINKLEKIIKMKINIYSDNWPKEHMQGVYGENYRRTINRSKIMINFITDSNFDEYSRRSIEIAACKTFFLSQKGKIQQKIFRENIETYYFENAEQCAKLILKFLSNEKEKLIISNNAFNRVKKLNLENKFQIKKIIQRVVDKSRS